MVAEEKAIGEYYRDTTQDTALQDTVCSASMLQEEEDEEREDWDIEEAITQGYIEETLSIWELYHMGLEIAQL
jgi:Ran GTPase-activating protein (RanGAP) involved in mRNA processing and transport